MKQASLVKFESEDKKIQIICEADVALGNLHDYILEFKGEIVNRMIEAHKRHEEENAKSKETEVIEEAE